MTRARWAVFAYHTFGARALAALLGRGEEIVAVVTHPDDPAEGGWFESVADLACRRKLPLFVGPSSDIPDLAAALAETPPDLILSVWYRRLLGGDLLAVPRVAALNLHGSLLPAYRGRAPLNWVLVNGERRTGVTLHHMTPEADVGDVIAQAPIDIEPDDTALSLYGRMVTVGVDLLLRAYPAVLDGTAARIPQDPARATCFGRRRPEDGRVSWTWPATQIVNMIRAVTHPFPGAFTGDGSARLWLWEGRVEAAAGSAAPPGALLEIRLGVGITVAAGEGTVLVTRVQEARASEERADCWALRRGFRPGRLLGDAA